MSENWNAVQNGEINDLHTVMLKDNSRNVYVGSSSIIGRRKTQQDSIKSDSDYAYAENQNLIAVLCDGMGGLNGGERASALCSAVVYDTFHSTAELVSVPAFFKSVIYRADEEVRTMRNDDGKSFLNAGTTLASVVIEDNNLYWASVGDSRIYIVRGSDILCITKDHNYLMLLTERVRKGEISQAEADNDPKKEALVSYIGMGGVRYVDMNSMAFQLIDGDRILLCSDGLYRCLTNAEIKEIVSRYKGAPQSAAEALTTSAYEKNLRHQDNTSVIVIEYQDLG